MDETAIPFPKGVVEARKEAVEDLYEEKGTVSTEVTKELRAFVLFGYGFIELYTSEIILKYIIDDEMEAEARDYISNSMSQNHRERLLQQVGIFNDQTRSAIGDVRGLRGDLAHNPMASLDWEEKRVEPRMEKIIEVMSRLHAGLENEQKIKAVMEDDDKGL